MINPNSLIGDDPRLTKTSFQARQDFVESEPISEVKIVRESNLGENKPIDSAVIINDFNLTPEQKVQALMTVLNQKVQSNELDIKKQLEEFKIHTNGNLQVAEQAMRYGNVAVAVNESAGQLSEQQLIQLEAKLIEREHLHALQDQAKKLIQNGDMEGAIKLLAQKNIEIPDEFIKKNFFHDERGLFGEQDLWPPNLLIKEKEPIAPAEDYLRYNHPTDAASEPKTLDDLIRENENKSSDELNPHSYVGFALRLGDKTLANQLLALIREGKDPSALFFSAVRKDDRPGLS